jgi:nucleoside-diphosphate-sugar epimerase
MTALVTGATGFLGSHLAERLLLTGWPVRVLVRDPGKAQLLQQRGAEVVVGDLTAPASLAPALDGVDTVFHCAALVTNWAPWSDFLAVTVRGTENLLAGAARAPLRRFIHVSTIRVYDDRSCRRRGVATEETPLGARGYRHFGYYARAKVMAEALVWQRRDALPVTVLRPAWIYGPGDETILPPLVEFLRSPRARWPSRTDPCADPIYVTDVADCAIAAALRPEAVGQAYNVAPADRISVRRFLGLLCSALGIRPPTRSAPYWLSAATAGMVEGVARLRGRACAPTVNRAGVAILAHDVRHDPAKAERELGWRSSVGLEEGVRRTAEWLRQRSHPAMPVTPACET